MCGCVGVWVCVGEGEGEGLTAVSIPACLVLFTAN